MALANGQVVGQVAEGRRGSVGSPGLADLLIPLHGALFLRRQRVQLRYFNPWSHFLA